MENACHLSLNCWHSDLYCFLRRHFNHHKCSAPAFDLFKLTWWTRCTSFQSKINKSPRFEHARDYRWLQTRRHDNFGRALKQLEAKGLLRHMKDNKKRLKRSLTVLGFINNWPLCSLSLSPLNFLSHSSPLKSSDWASSWTKRGGELGDKGQAWLKQELGAAVACCYGGMTLPPWLLDVLHGPLSSHTG